MEEDELMSKPIVCIDFDGVVHSYTSKFDLLNIPDPPVPGAFDAIRRFQRAGWDVCIYSSRSHDPRGVRAMRDWLQKHAAEEAAPFGQLWTMDVKFPSHKPPAFISIDDRGFQFNGDWSAFDPEELLKFRPWNKREAASTSPVDPLDPRAGDRTIMGTHRGQREGS